MAEYKQPIIVPNADISCPVDPNTLKSGDMCKSKGTPRMSMGDPGANKVKTDGILQRGAGAAVRGKTSRGPMA